MANPQAHTLHAFDFLDGNCSVSPITVLFGDEPFLKGLARRKIVDCVLSGDLDAPYAMLVGDEVEWRDVTDELFTVSLFGPGSRLVIVEAADAFVTRYRDRLEDYVETPKKSGVLVLDVGKWAKNTRLFNALNKTGLQVECRVPEKSVGKRKVQDELAVRTWLVGRADREHQFQLAAAAAEQLVDLVGPEFGLLDQALAKLALFVTDSEPISPARVNEIVGGWRTKTIWELVDAAADGRTAEALEELDHLLHSGEHPLALYGQIAWSLRRFAAATRIYESAERQGQRCQLVDALVPAGFAHWNRKALDTAERQLKRMGRHRSGQLYRWLLETDLALKGSHSMASRARLALEKLFLKLSV
jgi:DNA polymerase-3 subunit delta